MLDVFKGYNMKFYKYCSLFIHILQTVNILLAGTSESDDTLSQKAQQRPR